MLAFTLLFFCWCGLGGFISYLIGGGGLSLGLSGGLGSCLFFLTLSIGSCFCSGGLFCLLGGVSSLLVGFGVGCISLLLFTTGGLLGLLELFSSPFGFFSLLSGLLFGGLGNCSSLISFLALASCVLLGFSQSFFSCLTFFLGSLLSGFFELSFGLLGFFALLFGLIGGLLSGAFSLFGFLALSFGSGFSLFAGSLSGFGFFLLASSRLLSLLCNSGSFLSLESLGLSGSFGSDARPLGLLGFFSRLLGSSFSSIGSGISGLSLLAKSVGFFGGSSFSSLTFVRGAILQDESGFDLLLRSVLDEEKDSNTPFVYTDHSKSPAIAKYL